MGVDMKVKAIYDSEIGNITRSEKNWKDVLKVAGQLYRYEFDNIVMVTAQRPPEKSTLMADYDTWKKVGRYVKRGAKGCAIFPSRALNPRMRYIFDISDTGGKNVKLTWDLEGENLKDYVDFLVSEGQIEQYDNSDRESLKNILKQFTGTDVWLIIKEEFGDRMTELMQLSGSVIKEECKKRNGLQQEMDMEQLVYASVMYAVGTRCGFDLSVQEQDFSQIVNIKDEEIIYRLGSIVCDVSCSVLREFSRNLKAIESERRIGYVRRNDLQGRGRTALLFVGILFANLLLMFGLLYPQIEMPDETEDLTKLGKYGRMAMNYLKENEPARYKTLMRFGKMYEKMSAVEEEANQLYDQLEMQYLAKHKPQNPSSTMEMWKIREQAKMQAEEVVLHQIVMRFH